MSGDPTPERLDAILDGTAPPETDAERELLRLAADLRASEPRADGALRERVRAIAATPAPRPWFRLGGRRPRAIVAAPALAALVAAVVAVGVLTRDGGGDRNTAEKTAPAVAGATAAPTATKTPLTSPATTTQSPGSHSSGQAFDSGGAERTTSGVHLVVATGTLDARLADVRRIVTEAGGTLTTTPVPGTPAVHLAIALPPASAQNAIREIAKLASGTPPAIPVDAAGNATILLTEP